MLPKVAETSLKSCDRQKDKEISMPRKASANVSQSELNQSYTEQLERRISDLNVTIALKNKELNERKKLEKEQQALEEERLEQENFTRVQEELKEKD